MYSAHCSRYPLTKLAPQSDDAICDPVGGAHLLTDLVGCGACLLAYVYADLALITYGSGSVCADPRRKGLVGKGFG